MEWLLQPNVWVPLAIALFGVLVVWGAVRDFLKRNRRQRAAMQVEGTIIDFVAVHVPTGTRPLAAAIVEYTANGETKRFQTETLATFYWPVEPKSLRQRGDHLVVHIPTDGGEPWIGRTTANLGMLVVQVLLGLAVIGCAFIAPLFLPHS